MLIIFSLHRLPDESTSTFVVFRRWRYCLKADAHKQGSEWPWDFNAWNYQPGHGCAEGRQPNSYNFCFSVSLHIKCYKSLADCRDDTKLQRLIQPFTPGTCNKFGADLPKEGAITKKLVLQWINETWNLQGRYQKLDWGHTHKNSSKSTIRWRVNVSFRKLVAVRPTLFNIKYTLSLLSGR